MMQPDVANFDIQDRKEEPVKMGFMAVPHITTFCWCCGLETGAKVVGFLHLLVSVSIMVVSSIFMVQLGEMVDTVEDEDALYRKWSHYTTVALSLSVVHVILAGILLYASFKRYTVALRVWVWSMIVLYIGSLLDLIYSMTFGLSDTGSDIFLSFLEGVLFFGFVAYCILCVNSYYLMLKSAVDMEAPPKTDY